MGQYHNLVNLTWREYIDPHQLGDGLKLLEQAHSGPGGVGSALILLLAASNGRGGGDANSDALIGSWAGDRIAIVGDYAKDKDYETLPGDDPPSEVYGLCHPHDVNNDECGCGGAPEKHFKDITPQIRAALARNLEMVYYGDGGVCRTSLSDMGIPGFQYTHDYGDGRRLARVDNENYFVEDLITAWDKARMCAAAASGQRDWTPDWAVVLQTLTPVSD